MAVQISATSFSKRRNSTKIPESFDTTFDCFIKDNCDWNSPVFILNSDSFPYNYLKWGNQYYFVQTVSYIKNGVLEVSCITDVLATYKTDILNTSAFVMYDTVPNTEISDKRLSAKTTISISENVGDNFDYLGTGFSVALNVVGADSCCTYILPMASAATLLNQASVWNANYFPEVEDPEESGTVFEDVVAAIQKLDRIISYACRQFITSNTAADCITSACLIPIPYSAFSESAEEIYLGQFNTTVYGKKRLTRGIQDASVVSIPWQASDWRRNNPYHEVYLYVPFIGNISIPTSAIIGASNLYVNVSVDETAGDAIFTISTGVITAGSVTNVVGQYTSNLSANFPIGSANVTARTLATAIVGGVTAVASTAVAGPAGIAMGAAGIVGELNGINALPSTVGSAGGGAILALFGYAPRCMTIFHDTVVEPNSVAAEIGTPTMAVKTLSTLTGFVQCSNAKCSAAAHSDELDMIDNYLNTGFFIE